MRRLRYCTFDIFPKQCWPKQPLWWVRLGCWRQSLISGYWYGNVIPLPSCGIIQSREVIVSTNIGHTRPLRLSSWSSSSCCFFCHYQLYMAWPSLPPRNWGWRSPCRWGLCKWRIVILLRSVGICWHTQLLQSVCITSVFCLVNVLQWDSKDISCKWDSSLALHLWTFP